MPYRAHAISLPCRAPAILRECRVLRESPRASRKYPKCYSYSLTDWYASYNKLRGTPRGIRKKTNAGRPPTCLLLSADANSQCHAVPMPRCAVVLRSRFQNMTCVNQTAPHCVKWERHNLNTLRHGMADERHGLCMGTA
jgi:hypothetical protein